MTDHLDFRAEERAINRAFRSMIAKARAAGVSRPAIFAEGGKQIAVIDEQKTKGGMHNGAGVVGLVYVARDVPFDAGAW